MTSRTIVFQIQTSDRALQETGTWKLGHRFFKEPIPPTAVDHGDDEP